MVQVFAGRNVVGDTNTRKQRKLQKYSTNFNEIFSFFLKCHRSGIITFCGSHVDVDFDINGPDGRYTFRKFENGDYKTTCIISRHPNIVKSIITGKKGWGLWLNQWTDGIVEGTFTKQEILDEFSNKGIQIPDSLLCDFNNRLYTKLDIYYKSH